MRRLVLLLPLVLVLSGCFQVLSTLNVRPDGSAQLVERVTLEGMMAMTMMAGDEMLSGFVEMADSTVVEEVEEDPDEKLRQKFTGRAASLGEGVTVASVVEEIAPGQLTYVVTYDVPDVNAFAYDLSNAVDPDAMFGGGDTDEWEVEEWETEGVPQGEMEDVIGDGEIIDEPGEGDEIELSLESGMPPPAPPSIDDAQEDEDEEPFRFAFTPASGGAPATLRVTVPGEPLDMDELDLGQMTSGNDPEQDLKMAYIMFGRMEMRFDVVVEGELVSAERGWADGNRITLSSIRMGDLLDFARARLGDGGLEAILAAQRPDTGVDVPGLQFVGAGPLDIRFR